jgi:hypothetical protein
MKYPELWKKYKEVCAKLADAEAGITGEPAPTSEPDIELERENLRLQRENIKLSKDIEALSDTKGADDYKQAMEYAIGVVDTIVNNCCRHKAGAKVCEGYGCKHLLKTVEHLRTVLDVPQHESVAWQAERRKFMQPRSKKFSPQGDRIGQPQRNRGFSMEPPKAIMEVARPAEEAVKAGN